MKRYIIPVFIVVMVVGMLFAGCTTTPAPSEPSTPSTPSTPSEPSTPSTPSEPSAPVTEGATLSDIPELQGLIDKGLVDPDALVNPFPGIGVKPDGSPYVFALTYWSMVCEALTNWDGVNQSRLAKAGAEWLYQNPEADIPAQISWIEDVISGNSADCLMLHSTDEASLAPVSANCQEAGIPVIHWDRDMQPYSDPDEYVMTQFHYFNGQYGSNLVGQIFCDYAEKHNMDVHVFESWTYRSFQTCQDRHTGLHAAIDPHPMVTCTESGPEDNGSSERCMEHCIDAMTADPTINAIFVQDGGGPGAIEAVRSLGRLVPVGEEGHVVLALNDTDSAVMAALEDGYLDGFGTHGGYHLADLAIQAGLNYVCLGKPIPKIMPVPLGVVTSANKDTLMLYGATPVWPWFPPGEFDKWPVLDFSELGVPIPTAD